MAKFRVKLTYFKCDGKYHSGGEYETTKEQMFEIFTEVQELSDRQKLPGLIVGHGPFIALVDVPDHPNDHPALIMPGFEPGHDAASQRRTEELYQVSL